MHMESAVGQGRTLEREEWGPFFTELTRRLRDALELGATLVLVGDEVSGTEAEQLPLDPFFCGTSSTGRDWCGSTTTRAAESRARS